MSYERIGEWSGSLRGLAIDAEKVLLAADGSISNFAGYKATRLQQRDVIMEVFRPQLAGVFPGEWRNALITQVLPNGCIPPHHDVPQADTLRYHLVLATNELSWVMHDGDWQQLEAGGIYTMNARKTHAAVNWGAMPRTHLVVDVDTVAEKVSGGRNG